MEYAPELDADIASISSNSSSCEADASCRYLAGVSRYPLEEAKVVFVRIGSTLEGSHPRFLELDGPNEGDGEGDNRRREWSDFLVKFRFMQSKASEAKPGEISGTLLGAENGLNSPGTDSLKVNGKNIKVVSSKGALSTRAT